MSEAITSNIRTVYFHGSLAKKYGKKHEFVFANWFQLLSGFVSRFGPGIKDVLKNGEYALFDGKKKVENNISQAEFEATKGTFSQAQEEFHILPRTKGSSGVVRFIIGVILIVVGVYFGQPWLVQIGMSLAIGGIAEMLMKQPTSKEFEGGSSNLISQARNVTTQGGPVPILYGRVKKASSVIINSDFQAGEK